MATLHFIDAGRNHFRQTRHSTAKRVTRSYARFTHLFSFESLLLKSECREELENLFESCMEEVDPGNIVEFFLASDIVSVRWRLARLARIEREYYLEADEQMEGKAMNSNSVMNLIAHEAKKFEALDRQRTHLLNVWEKSLSTLRKLQAKAPTDPEPPAKARLVLITNRDMEEPVAPDRRRPHEPSLPVLLPLAA